jgi:hypothetical protein
MKETFNYHHEVTQHREVLWTRLAEYARDHPQEKEEEICRQFNIGPNTLWKACSQNGLKRKMGRKPFHFPPKAE